MFDIQRRGLITTGLVCLTTIVSHSFGRSTLGLLLPAIEDDLGLTHAEAGRPGTFLYLAYIAAVVLVAVAASRFEPITIMRVALLSAAVGFFLAATATGIASLTVGVALAGGSGAGIWLTAPTLATAHVSEERRGMVISLLSASIGLANIALGFGTTVARRTLDDDLIWRPVWGVEVGFTLALLALLVLVARFERTERLAGGFGFDLLRQVPHWVRVTLAYACFGSMAAGFLAFMLVALEEQGFTRDEATGLFTIMGIVGMVVTPFLGAASDRFGRQPFLIGAMGVLTASNLLIAVGGRRIVVVAVMGFAAMAGTFPSLVATYVRDHVTDRAFSRVMATMTILFSIAASAAPATVGWLADATGSFQASFLLLAAVAGVGMGLIAFRPARVE